MRIKDIPHHLRPREKLVQKGVSALKDKELLAIILRTGTKKRNVIDLSEYILKKYPINKLVNIGYQDLVKIGGVDIGKASILLSSIEFAKRALNKQENQLPIINSPQDAVDQLAQIRNLKKEHFTVLYLNARNQLLNKEIVTVGTLNASLVHPREVFEPAIRLSAAAVLVAHNHPSGDSTPSTADMCITSQLIKAGEILGIEVIDHLILTQTNYISMKEEGCLS